MQVNNDKNHKYQDNHLCNLLSYMEIIALISVAWLFVSNVFLIFVVYSLNILAKSKDIFEYKEVTSPPPKIIIPEDEPKEIPIY